MPEQRKRLTAKLNEVEEHLDAAEPVDSTIEEPLHQTLGSVRQVAESPPSGEEEHEELTEALGDLALSLEVSHPKLTNLLNHISELLAGAGI